MEIEQETRVVFTLPSGMQLRLYNPDQRDIDWLNGIDSAVKAEREECAKIADARALRCDDVAQGYIGLDEDEVASLRSLAWQFSVLAAEMRKRSNAPHEGPSGASREGPLDAVVGRRR